MTQGAANDIAPDARTGLTGEAPLGPMGSWTHHLRTGQIEWVAGTEELFGLAPGTSAGTFDALLELVYPDDRAKVERTIRQAIEHGARHEFEFRVVWPDGSIHWVFGRGRVVADADGRPIRITTVAVEISQRKAEVEALAASEQEFRTLFELAGAGTVLADPISGRFLRVNQRFCEMTGYTEAELLSRTFLDITHPGDHERNLETLDRTLRGATDIYEIEKRYIRKDGQIVWVVITGRLMWDASGQSHKGFATILDVTERKRVEQVLRDSEERYRDLFENANDIIYTLDLEGRITSVNRRAEQAFGYTREECLGRNAAELVPAEYHMLMRDALQRKLAGEVNPTAYELELIRKDGRRVPLEVNSRLITQDGRPIGIQGIARDVSDRRQAAQALQRSEMRFRKLVEQSPLSTQILAPDGRILRVNRAWEQLWGVKIEDVPDYNLLQDQQLEARGIMPYILRAFAGEAMAVPPVGYVPTRGMYQGQQRWVRAFLYPVKDEEGRIDEVVALHEDITEYRRAEEALRESGERLRLALDAGRIGAWDWDLRQNKVTWSKRIYEFHGLQPGTFGGQVEDFTALVHPEDSARVAEAIRQSLEQKQPYGIEFRIVRPNGEVRWIATNGRVLFDEAGQPVRMLGATIDVTERRASEEVLREADRRKDEFLAMLAHELRNPLAPIRNSVQVLKLIGSTHPNLTQARDMIDRQVAHMARLVDDLLDVSRITQGKILLRKERLDLLPLVKAAVEDHRSLLEGTGLRLVVDLPKQPLWVCGDPTRLAQVVGNLLHNANKFTDAGGEVAVLLIAHPDPATAEITVRDTGIGMGPDILSRLFEPFSQADRSIDRSRGGLGLGLALVKGLMELHGGTTRAASPGVGKGSEFTIRLPLIAEPGADTQGRGSAGLSGKRSLRILVVEDHRDAAESLRMLLELTGHQVAVAHTGTVGVEVARDFRPDVVLCDIGLPGGMDGYGVARALRADSEQCAIALIALSGYGQEEDQRKARQAGFDRHLTKPVDPAGLMRLLDTLPLRPDR